MNERGGNYGREGGEGTRQPPQIYRHARLLETSLLREGVGMKKEVGKNETVTHGWREEGRGEERGREGKKDRKREREQGKERERGKQKETEKEKKKTKKERGKERYRK